MDFSGIAKIIKTIIIWTLLVLFLGSILDIHFEDWIKIYVPKPSVKVEENVSRETLDKIVYEIDGKEVTEKEYLEIKNEKLKTASVKSSVNW
ncbi:MAG: hypothetical protein ACXAAH_05525 [Promethearchaeota archaeon]|jgi:hypothetical protein